MSVTTSERMAASERNDPLLTVGEAGDYLGTGERFIRRLIAQRRITYVKLGKYVRLQRSTLDAFIDRSVETIVVGGNDVPPFVVVDGLMRDLVIHTWDLARAVGGDEHLPADLVAAATEAMKMVTDEARGPGLYGYPVAVPPDADAQRLLLASSGRRS